jgi:hypothetical protein
MSSRLLLGVTVLLALLVAGHSEPGEGSWPEPYEHSWPGPGEAPWWFFPPAKPHDALKRLDITACPDVKCLLSMLKKELSEDRIGAFPNWTKRLHTSSNR